MKNLITTSFFLLCLNLMAQNDSIPQEQNYDYYNSFNDYWKTVTFKIGGGVFLPQGKFKTYFNTSPLVELSLDFPVTDNKSIELVLQFIIPKQKTSFQCIRDTENIEAEALLIVNPFLRFKKELGNSDSSKFILGLGIGASVISSNQKVNSSNNDDSYEITSFLLAPSLDYVKSFRNNEQLTFSFGIQYSPYKIKGATQEDIGSLALTPRILYSF